MSDSITILIVEDEPLIRMEIADELSNRNFAVLEAANAIEAIGILISHPEIDIIFTDVDMPGRMDGLMLPRRCATGGRRSRLSSRPATDMLIASICQNTADFLASRTNPTKSQPRCEI